MPTKNRSKNPNGHAMLNFKSTGLADGAKLTLNKRETAQRAKRTAVVKHVCPVCAWDSAASRRKKKSARMTETRNH